MLSALLTLIAFGFVGLVLLVVVMAVVGTVFGLAMGLVSLLLFKVAPVLLVGWLVLKLIGRTRDRSRLPTPDQRWLDS